MARLAQTSHVAVRKCTKGPCTAAYLAIRPFCQVIRTDLTRVFSNASTTTNHTAKLFNLI